MGSAAAAVIPTLRITELRDLHAIKDEIFPATFILNIKKIFEYQTDQIPMVFDDRKKEILKKLRAELLAQVKHNVTEFNNKTPLSRQKKSEFVSDIIILGEYLARPTTNTTDLLSLFPADLTHQPTLIQVVEQLKSDLEALKSDNIALKIVNKSLNERLLKCEAALDLVESHESIDDIPESREEGNNTAVAEEQETGIVLPVVPLCAAPPVSPATSDEGTPRETFVYIGNVNPNCSRKSILHHITENNINVNMDLSAIQEIPSKKKDKRAFKVAVPHDKLHRIVSTLPTNVSASKWRGTAKNHKNPSVRKFPARSHGNKFRQSYPRSRNHQNEYRTQQDWPAGDYYHPSDYSRSNYQYSYW